MTIWRPSTSHTLSGGKAIRIKLYEILPKQLYQRGKLHHHSDQAKALLCKELNIHTVVGLVSPPDPFFDSWGGYIYAPMPDGKFQSRIADHLLEIAAHVANKIRGGSSALIYCEAGRNRSSLLSALVVMELKAVTGKEALGHVLNIRPNAFSNDAWSVWLEHKP